MAGQTLMLTVEEAGHELRLGKTATSALIKSGVLPSVKIGGSRRVRRTELEAYINGLPASLPDDSEEARAA